MVTFIALKASDAKTSNIPSRVRKQNQEEIVPLLKLSSNESSLAKWLRDEDKICTDGKDDGKLSFKEAAISFGKGFVGILKSVINNPFQTIGSVTCCVGLCALTGGAALPIMTALGVLAGAGTIVYSGYKAATAKNDSVAKQAFETMGSGSFVLASSALSAKQSLKVAAKAGVDAAEGLACSNPIKNVQNCFKLIPESITTTAKNVKGNLLTMTTGRIHANCNELREDTMPYKSKPSEVQAYRFNPNGTPEEILANNPGVFQGEDGAFYIRNIGDANAPFKIDTTKEQMIMMYGGDDMAVCDGGVFSGSYVDTAAFKADGSLNYHNPVHLEYGKIISATKQAFGEFKMVELGTEVQTLEGVNVIDPGEIISIDHEGNPYVVMMAKQSQKVDFIPKAS